MSYNCTDAYSDLIDALEKKGFKASEEASEQDDPEQTTAEAIRFLDWQERARPIQIPDEQWEQTGTAKGKLWGRLSSSIQVNGLPMHVEAFAVKKARTGYVAASREFDFEVDRLQKLDPDVWLRSLRILDRDYLLCITPYGE